MAESNAADPGAASTGNPISLALAVLKRADVDKEGWTLLRRTLLLCLLQPGLKLLRDTQDLFATTETSRRDVTSFRRRLMKLAWCVLGAIAWRGIIKHHQKHLEVLWREAITRRLHDKYIRGIRFYDAMFHRKEERRIADADVRICEDVPLVAEELAKICAELPTSMLDFVLGIALSLTRGSWRLIVSSVSIVVAGVIVPSFIAPVNPTEVQKPRQAALSELQHRLTRMQANDEQICALQGSRLEKRLADEALTNAIVASHETNCRMRWNQAAQYLMLGIGLPGYTDPGRSATVAASLFFGIPFYANLVTRARLQPKGGLRVEPVADDIPGMAERFTDGLFFLNYSSFVGFGLLGIAQNLLALTMVAGQLARVKELFDCLDYLEREATEGDAKSAAIKDCVDMISFEAVDINTPTGVPLVKGLEFEVGLGDSLLVTGHNGAGKSSIFRVLGSLWAAGAGTIHRPLSSSGSKRNGVYYCPQKPYAVLGTLSDLFFYPHQPPQEDCRVVVRRWLSFVDLEHIADRPDAFDVEHDWEEELSLGELQRINMVRLFYHQPAFVILDECTSAVSLDMEQRLFELCRALGISHVTIAHRPMMEQLHHRMLMLTGKPAEPDGGWRMKTLPPPSAIPKQVEDSSPASVIEKYLQDRGLQSRTALVSPSKSTIELDRPKPRSLAGQGGMLAQLCRIVTALNLGLRGVPDGRRRLTLVLVMCIVRTFLNTYNFTTGISSCIVAALTNNSRAFWKNLSLGMASGGALACIDALIVKQTQALELSTWQALASRLHTGLFSNDMLYALRLQRPLLVEDPARRVLDVRLFVENCFGHVYTTLQPILMFTVGASIVISKVGFMGVAALFATFGVGRMATKVLMPNFADQVTKQVELESKFKIVHSRLRQHAEAVAFSDGAAVERKVVERRFAAMAAHLRRMLSEEFCYSTTKLALTDGSGLPLFALKSLGMRFATASFGLALENGATSAAKLGANLDFDRVVQVITVPPISVLADIPENLQRLDAEACKLLELDELLQESSAKVSAEDSSEQIAKETNKVEVKRVTMATPSGTVLARQLDLVIESGSSLVATGPNASGKSSFSRLLCGLWDTKEGSIRVCGQELRRGIRPSPHLMYTATERPYLCHGRPLCAQICYPLDGVDISEEDLRKLLSAVGLEYLLERFNPWTELPSWQDVLSGGEQQRLCIARVLFHQPRFAVLDDCTSMVSQEAEVQLFKALLQKEITLIGMSQRLLLPDIFKSELMLGTASDKAWAVRQLHEGMRLVRFLWLCLLKFNLTLAVDHGPVSVILTPEAPPTSEDERREDADHAQHREVSAAAQSLDADMGGLLVQIQALRGALNTSEAKAQRELGTQTPAGAANATSNATAASGSTNTTNDLDVNLPPEVYHKDGETVTSDWRHEYPPWDSNSSGSNSSSVYGQGSGAWRSTSLLGIAMALSGCLVQLLSL